MINSHTSFGKLKEVVVGRELSLTKRLSDITFKQMNGPYYGIVFSDGTKQTTAKTTTSEYWQPFDEAQDTPIIYYTNRVIIGADPYSTNQSINEGTKLAINGNVAINGFLYAGTFSNGTAINKFSVDGATGNTSISGTITVDKDALINGLTVGLGPGSVGTNTVLGVSALNSNISGEKNVAIGYNALKANTTNSMTAVGYQALLKANPSSSSATSTAIGYRTLEENTTGGGNTALGYAALQKNTTTDNNTAIGAFALQENITGTLNTGVGYSALGKSTNGKQNTALGYQALYNINSSDANSVSYNTAIGSTALYNSTTGSNNTAVGQGALTAMVTGSNNTAVGQQSLYYYDGKSNNTSLGYRAGGGFISAANPIQSNFTPGNNNTFLGTYADVSGNSFSNSTAIGYNSKITAPNQIVLGGLDSSSNYPNVYVPGKLTVDTSRINTTDTVGIYTTNNSSTPSTLRLVSADGRNYIESGISETTGSSADLFFTPMFYYNTIWMIIKGNNGNVGIGTANPEYKLDVSGTLGVNGDITQSNSETNNIVQSTITTNTNSNNLRKTDIYGDLELKRPSSANGGALRLWDITTTNSGYSSQLYNTGTQFAIVNLNNGGSITLNTRDNSSNPTTPLTVKYDVVTINTKLDVIGTCQATNFNSTSDYRIKENVINLNDSINDSINKLSFNVDNLRPVTYKNKLSGKQDMGFIAHELQEHFPFLVSGEKDGLANQSVNYIGLIALLVKEIQELKQEIKNIKNK